MEIGAMNGTSSMRGIFPPGGRRPQGDPAQHAEGMSSRIMDQKDTDGDGVLSTEELGSEFDSELVNTLDGDGDGVLSQEELQSGIQTRMEEMKAGFMSGKGPSAEDKAFMQQVHELMGEPMPNRPRAMEAYTYAGGSNEQLLAEQLNRTI